MQLAAYLTLTLFIGLLAACTYFSIRLQVRANKQRSREQVAANRLALELDPHYQAKVEAERKYALDRARLDLSRQKLALKQADFRLKEYLALHRVPAETYSINEEPGTITAFPSLKPAAAAKEKGLDALSSLAIPPAYDLFDIFATQQITPEQIFLGKCRRETQELLFAKASQLHHAAFSASTGYGKTTLIRGIIPQLLRIGHRVLIADLKYTDVTEKGEDWRPIAARIGEQEPLTLAQGYRLPNILRREEHIAALLYWLAYPEMQRRLDMRARRNFSYETLDVFLEELIALTLAYPQVTRYILRIISLGRELRLNLFTTAQNMQVSSVGLSGGAREQFSTAWFLGGDESSAAALLDMTRKELSDFLHGNNIILGQGLGMMRNNYIMPTAGIVRLGYSSNESVYSLLGKAEHFVLAKAEEDIKKHRS